MNRNPESAGLSASSEDHSGETRASSCLCLDLDGTLVRTDTLLESLLILLRAAPWRFFRVLRWLFKGKARLKQEVGREAVLNVETLPYARAVIDYAEAERRQGRKLYLVTGADASIAMPVAEHLGFFSGVICSNGSKNRTGATKLAAIREVLGDQGFTYVGDSRDDIPVWKAAKSAVIVGANGRIQRALKQAGVTVERVIPGPRLSVRTMARAMRIHQWLKNFLVPLPVVLGHHVMERATLLSSVRAFFAFSFCASAIYLINDLLDLPVDRKHVQKRFRPLAAGDLPIPHALFLAILLLAAAAVVNPTAEAALLLALYGVSAISYSLYFKRLLMLDVILLAGFYTLRLLYGGVATGITVSIWTLAFSVFMFLSLALIKRISELCMHSSEDGMRDSGRGYRFTDLPQLSALCAASGSVGVLIVILYVRSPDVLPLYSRPYLLLGIVPLLAYWQSRLLILACRGSINQDPIMFSISDRASQAVALLLLLIVAASL